MRHLPTLLFALGLLLTPVSAALQEPAQVAFPDGIVADDDATLRSVLEQSANYDDGVLTIGGREYAFDAYDHLILRQHRRGLLCRWFGWFCPLQLGEISVTKEQAADIMTVRVLPQIRNDVIAQTGQMPPLMVFAYPRALPAGTVVFQEFEENPPLNVLRDSWFFFVDLDPEALFGHRAEFVLVDAVDGTVTRRSVFSPPRIDGQTHYLNIEERFATHDRIYPASIDDLPPPIRWPIQFNSDIAPAPGMPEDSVPMALSDRIQVVTVDDLASAFIATASAQANPADPCGGRPPRKVAVLISGEGPGTRHDDGLVDGGHMQTAQNAMAAMLRSLGFAPGDIHAYNPQANPDLKTVFDEIKQLTAGLGPCDKFFFYVFGHGSIVDENNDHKPDTPSTSIAYGHGEGHQWISKTRFGDFSLIELFESIPAGKINIIIESCFSGSFTDFLTTNAANPMPGSSWTVFTASTKDNPSYGNREKGAHYTDALARCVDRLRRERGIANPTVAEMEQLMRDCQLEILKKNDPYIFPRAPIDATHADITVTPPDLRVKEGDDGVTPVTFEIRVQPTDRTLEIRYMTYFPENAGKLAIPVKDYGRVRSAVITFEPGETVKRVTFGIVGDTLVEGDEVFGVWFMDIPLAIYTVTIVDDDGQYAPASSASSRPRTQVFSSASSASSSVPEPTTELERWGKLLGEALENDGGSTRVDGGSITIIFVDDHRGHTPSTCPLCEKERAAVSAQEAQCTNAENDLLAAKADLLNATAGMTAAQNSLDRAKKAQEDFERAEQSWAESNGRRVTGGDLQILDEYNRELWSQYRDGTLSAEGLEQKWKDGLSDAERAARKDARRKKLQADINAAQKAFDAATAARDKAQAAIDAAQRAFDACQKALADLRAALKACEEKCVPIDTGTFVDPYEDYTRSSAASQSASTKYVELKDLNIYVPAGETKTVDIPVPISSASSQLRIELIPASSAPSVSGLPSIRSVYPGNGAKDFPVDGRIRIEFTVPMQRSTVETAFRSDFEHEKPVVTDTSIEVVPLNLEEQHSYQFGISTTATDTSGRPLDATLFVKFMTAEDKPEEVEPEHPDGIPVVIINGKAVSVNEVMTEGHDECPSHYHAVNGEGVRALDGSFIQDPGGCQGYGRSLDRMTCTPDGKQCW